MKLNNEVLNLTAAQIRKKFAFLIKAMAEASEAVADLYLEEVQKSLTEAGRPDIARKWYHSKITKAVGRLRFSLYSTHPFAKLRELGSGYLDGGVVRAGKNPPKCGSGGPVTKYLTVPLGPAKSAVPGRQRSACMYKNLVPMFRKGADRGILAKVFKTKRFVAYFALVPEVRIPPHPTALKAIEKTRPKAQDVYRFYVARALQGQK